MANVYNMRQCGLRCGNAVQRAWIPERFAVAGKFLKLHDRDSGQWEDGWQVTSVGDGVLPSDVVTERSQDYKRTRQASDT
jgi:hypothetical protein